MSLNGWVIHFREVQKINKVLISSFPSKCLMAVLYWFSSSASAEYKHTRITCVCVSVLYTLAIVSGWALGQGRSLFRYYGIFKEGKNDLEEVEGQFMVFIIVYNVLTLRH